MVSSQLHYTKVNRFMPFLLAEILNFQGSTHHIGVGSFSNLNKVLPFSRFKKVSGNTLYVESETAGYWRNPASLKNLPSITVETKFTVKNNKITCASWNSKVTGSRTFYAQNSFRTSKSMTKLSVKDGPYVRAGQKVTLNYIRLNRSTFLYQISVNGRTGWFADSQSIKFR